jgi:hypothetical protein
MRMIEIYEKGDFPKLVLETKKQFAATYALESEYWRTTTSRSRPRCAPT